MSRRYRPKTRRHLKYDTPKIVLRLGKNGLPTRVGLTAFGSRNAEGALLVNTGKDYNAQEHVPWAEAVTNQRDIRGHGHGTSRVRRAYVDGFLARQTAFFRSDAPVARRMSLLGGDA